jgi:exosortase/archaeosortase family protein
MHIQKSALNDSFTWVKIGILISAMLVIYSQDVSAVFENASRLEANNISNYILILPFLILYVLYTRRNVLKTAIVSETRQRSWLDETLGITMCVLALIIFFYSSSTLYEEAFKLYSLPLFVAGSILLVFNMNTLRHSIFAVLLLTFLQPVPAELVGDLAADMSWVAASFVQSILSAFGMPIVLEATYGAPALVVEKESGNIPFFVGEPSSGVYSIMGMSMFALFVASISRGVWWKRILIFALGLPVFYLLNILRIALIVSLWYGYGLEVAEAFHAVGGMIVAAGGTVVLLLISDRMIRTNITSRRTKRERCEHCRECADSGESFCLFCGSQLKSLRSNVSGRSVAKIVLLIMIASAVLVQAQFRPTLTPAIAEQNIAELNLKDMKGPETVEYFLPPVEGWSLQYAYRDVRVEKVLNQDASLAYRYTKEIAADPETEMKRKLTVYAGVQISGGHHTWEASLIISPSKVGRPTVDVLELKDVKISESGNGRYFVYKRPNSALTEAVLYEFYRLPFQIGSHTEYRNVQVSLWTYTDNFAKVSMIKDSSDTEAMEKILLEMYAPIAKLWDSRKTQSVQSMFDTFFSNNASALAGASMLPAGIGSLHAWYRGMKTRKTNRRLYEDLFTEEQKIIDIVRDLNSKGIKATGSAIIKEYRKFVPTINETEMAQMLSLAKEVGLLKSAVIDELGPVLIWKPAF